MKILVVCDQGNNRSVNFAHRLRYWKHEVIPVGINVLSFETLSMMYKWADKIIIVHGMQWRKIPEEFKAKTVLFDVGADQYPRPFNPQLDQKVRDYLEQNKDWLKQ